MGVYAEILVLSIFNEDHWPERGCIYELKYFFVCYIITVSYNGQVYVWIGQIINRAGQTSVQCA